MTREDFEAVKEACARVADREATAAEIASLSGISGAKVGYAQAIVIRHAIRALQFEEVCREDQ